MSVFATTALLRWDDQTKGLCSMNTFPTPELGITHTVSSQSAVIGDSLLRGFPIQPSGITDFYAITLSFEPIFKIINH